MNKDIVFIHFDPLPPLPNKEKIKKIILVSFLTPSLLPKIFVCSFLKTNFSFLNHNKIRYHRKSKDILKDQKRPKNLFVLF